MFLPFEAPVAYARIAVERAVDRYPEGLLYAVPPDLEDLAPGERVVVPLGRGDTPAPGYVIEIEASTKHDPSKLKRVVERDPGSALPVPLLQLATWISRYYCAPIGMTLGTMIPAAVKRSVGVFTRRYIDLPDAVPDDARKPTATQQRILDALAALEPDQRPIAVDDLLDRAKVRTNGPLRRLEEEGHVRVVHKTSIEARWIDTAVDTRAPESLTVDQQGVVDAVGDAIGNGFSAHLLHGVTGSGKTEVYVRLLREVVARGKTALVLVPEIALTPQTGGRLVGRFPDERVAILHSGLSAAQRNQQWAIVARGEASIVLGARSAIFAPIPAGDIGLIIVDEEHDASYKQDQVPRYHGRDVALRRGQIEQCPVLLGSATPSLESWMNATERGTYRLHRLRERAPGLKLPAVRVVDLAAERRARGGREMHILGPTLEGEMQACLERRGQAIVLMNRRGYANLIACPSPACGWVMQCEDCDVTMVFHQQRSLPQGGFVRCHHCQREQRLPKKCPSCDRAPRLLGQGTQRVESELARKFPSLIAGQSLVRIDSDTMRSATDFHAILGRFGAGEIDVLVGTQMIAKGLDFPGVELVGVINADTALHMPDFRAAERTFQLVNQVAGRCGRGSRVGRVVVQTYNPDMPAVALAAAQDYDTFAREELASRHAAALPPATRMARVIVRHEDPDRADERAEVVASAFTTLGGEEVRVIGPMPCPIPRLVNKYRREIQAIAPDAAILQRLLTRARERGILAASAGMAIDVDPVAMM